MVGDGLGSAGIQGEPGSRQQVIQGTGMTYRKNKGEGFRVLGFRGLGFEGLELGLGRIFILGCVDRTGGPRHHCLLARKALAIFQNLDTPNCNGPWRPRP